MRRGVARWLRYVFSQAHHVTPRYMERRAALEVMIAYVQSHTFKAEHRMARNIAPTISEDAAATTSTPCSPPPAITTAFPARTGQVFAPANPRAPRSPVRPNDLTDAPQRCYREASITLRRACRICLLHLPREIRTIRRHLILLANVCHRGSDIRDRIIDRLRRGVGVVGSKRRWDTLRDAPGAIQWMTITNPFATRIVVGRVDRVGIKCGLALA